MRLVSIPLVTRSEAGLVESTTITVDCRQADRRWIVCSDDMIVARSDGRPAEFLTSSEAMAFALEHTGWLHAVVPFHDTETVR